MNRLDSLRTQLALMSWARSMLRWGQAILISLTLLLVVLALLFAADFGLERLGMHTTTMQRGVLICVALAFWVVISLVYAIPLLRRSESVTDMALMIEGEQRIDSDLIAALQFESPQSAGWGSHDLQHAVIDYVAD